MRQMDHTNRQRFEPAVTEYTNEGPATKSLPSCLWKTIDDYYTSRTEETKFIPAKVLDSTTQDQSTPILDHLTSFQTAVTNLRLAGGIVPDTDLGRRLLASLHHDHMNDARDILNRGVISYPDVVNELRRRVNTDLMLGKKPITIEANAAARRRPKCTAQKCVGTKHTPAECFRKPCNEHLMQAWVAERQKMGLWRNQPSSSANQASSSPSPIQSPSIQALQASFDSMTIKPQCYHTQSAIPLTPGPAPNISSSQDQSFTALLDTGATHHMIRESHAFDPESYTDISD